MTAPEASAGAGTPLHVFVRDVARGVTGTYFVETENERTVPIMVVTAAPGAPLVICFNGAMSQAAYPYPSFAMAGLGPAVAGLATLLVVSDPSLALSPELNVAWYAGDFGLDTPEALRTIFQKLRRKLAPRRVVFVSGSSGAHAALVHSRDVPGSICLLQNPLPRISSYFAGPLTEYRKHCWPGVQGPLSEVVLDDAASLYVRKAQNHVLVLQNSMDPMIRDHLSALLAALPRPPKAMLLCEYFPEAKGHMYPSRRWADFVRAAVTSPLPSLELIIATATAGSVDAKAGKAERNLANARRLAAQARAETSDE